MLLDCSTAHGLSIWRYWGLLLRGTLLIRSGDINRGLHLLLSSLESPPETGSQLGSTWFLGRLAEGFRRADRIADATLRITEALACCERNEDRWCMAEPLRIKADILVQSNATAAAEELFGQALDLARRQGSLA
jgi:hypothetical protein